MVESLLGLGLEACVLDSITDYYYNYQRLFDNYFFAVVSAREKKAMLIIIGYHIFNMHKVACIYTGCGKKYPSEVFNSFLTTA